MMKRTIISIASAAAGVFISMNAAAQPAAPVAQQWTLRQCIEYAVENNISVQQMNLNSANAEIQLNTARNSRLPNLSASLGVSSNFGRALSRDNVYIDRTQISGNANVSTGIQVFNAFSINNTIKARQYDFQASLHDMGRAREDVALNVTSLYMQVLFNKELLKVAESQVELSRDQLKRSELLFGSGKSPESEVYESGALVARDELTLTERRNALSLSLLDLVQALNMPEYGGIDVRMPSLEDIDVMSMNTLDNPRDIYAYSLEMRPGVLAEKIRLESSHKNLSIAKAARYPSVSMSAGYSNGAYYTFASGVINQNFGKQLNSNGSESVSMNISIPIFNRLATRNSIRSAELSIKNQELAVLNVEQTLYKEIEQSHHNATAAYDKYLSAVKSVDAARIAFRYAEEKSAAGRSTIFDFNDAKTRLERSESEAIQAKFEFIWRRKVLDFYSGKPLEFQNYQ